MTESQPDDREGDGLGGGRATRQLPLAWRRALVATAGLWAVVALLTAVAAGTLPATVFTPDAGVPGFPGWPMPSPDATGWPLLRDALVRFDALYYLGIARDGYPAGGDGVADAWAFLPAYPAIVGTVGWLLGGRVLLAATLVSTTATVTALAGVHRLVEQLVGSGTARAATTAGRAVLLTAVFPTSFFLLAPYAESVHLAAVVWSLVAVGRGHPARACLLGGVAAAARPVGLALVLPLLLAPGPDGRPPSPARRAVAAAGPMLGTAAVALHAWVATGDPLAPVAAQARWQRVAQSPLRSIADAVGTALSDLGAAGSGFWLLDLVVALVAVSGIAIVAGWSWRRRPSAAAGTASSTDLRPDASVHGAAWLGAALVVHGLASVAGWLVRVFPARPLMSVPRFALVVPAVVVGLALATGTPRRRHAWVTLSAVLLAVHLLLFSRWSFVF